MADETPGTPLGVYDAVRWLDTRTVLWTIQPEMNKPEVITSVWDECMVALEHRTGVGMIVDIREAPPPSAASRASIREGTHAIRKHLCGLALVVGDSAIKRFVADISMFLISDANMPTKALPSVESACTWLDSLRAPGD